MTNFIIIALAACFVTALLYFSRKQNRPGILTTKTTASLLFILLLLNQGTRDMLYYYLILAGLVFCLFGDVFLAIPSKKAFLLGLVSFLIGHVFYAIGFIHLAGTAGWVSFGPPVFLIISAYVFFRLKPYLGPMLIPVLGYMVVITTMLCGAWGVFLDPDTAFNGRFMTFLGASLFYLSDIFVARERFVGSDFRNRLIGLPLYYAGQFLLALAVGYL